MKPILVALCCGLLLAGCEKSNGEDATVLEIGAFEVIGGSADKTLSLVVTSDGEVSIDGRVVGQVLADGRAKDASGKVIVTLAQDGTLRFIGESETGTISKDGTWASEGTTVLSVSEDGVYSGGYFKEGKKGASLRLVGDAKYRRTATLVLTFAM